jgi:hypothetical protein
MNRRRFGLTFTDATLIVIGAFGIACAVSLVLPRP